MISIVSRILAWRRAVVLRAERARLGATFVRIAAMTPIVLPDRFVEHLSSRYPREELETRFVEQAADYHVRTVVVEVLSDEKIDRLFRDFDDFDDFREEVMAKAVIACRPAAERLRCRLGFPETYLGASPE